MTANPELLLISGLIGALVSATLNIVFNAWNNDRKFRAARRLIAEEVEVCGEFAETFCTAAVAAPQYRLPTAGFQTALKELIAVGELSEDGVRELIRFYSEVETLNRGLDHIAGAVSYERSTGELGDAQRTIHNRNLLKAERIRKPAGIYYQQAANAVAAKKRVLGFIPQRITTRH